MAFAPPRRLPRPSAGRGAGRAGAVARAVRRSQAAVRPPKLQYQMATLPNGLRVILSEDHSTPIVHVSLWYHVGSKNERPGRTGFAHLFEHMMFKGSKNVEPESHTSIIASVGGRSNAYTTEDETVFWQTLPAQYLPLVLWMEADRMATLRIDDDAFRREREVVKEERRMRVENQPYGRLSEIIYDHAFTTHPYKHPTIGSMADLEAASIEDVREFHSTFYVPENATLTIVGDFDAAQALQLVTQYFGRVPKAARPVPRDIPKEPAQTQGAARRRRGGVAAAGGGRRLSRHLRRPPGRVSAAHHVEDPVRRAERADSARAGLQQAAGADARSAAATSPRIRTCSMRWPSCSRGRRRQAAEKALIDEFEKLKREPVTATRAAARQEPVRARLHRRPRVEPGQGAAPGARRRDPQRHHDRRRRVRHLHERDARPTCSAWRRPTSTRPTASCCTSCRRPAGRGEAGRCAIVGCPASTLCGVWVARPGCRRWRRPQDSPSVANWPSERPPRPLPAREVKFPPYEMRTLANGMQVLTVLHHEQPAVTHAAAGRRRRGAGPGRARPGVASLVGAAARSGHDDAQRRADCRSDRLDRRRARHRLRHRPDVRQRRRDEGLVRPRRWTCWPTSSAIRRSRRRRSTGRSSRRSRRCR